MSFLCSSAPSALAPQTPFTRVHPQQPSPSEKDSRTPAQLKINSRLLYEIYRRRGEAEQKGVPPGPTGVDIDAHGRALVDVRAEATAALQKTIRSRGGVIVTAERSSLRARVPLLELERLAAEPAVKFIEPAGEAMTHRPPRKSDS